MTPKNENDFVGKNIEMIEMPSLTYDANWEKERMQGTVDGKEAIEQAIYKVLNTQKDEFLIYDENYGIALKDLFGRNITFVIPELKKCIEDALKADDRIETITDFEFEKAGDELSVSFRANTKAGAITIGQVVKINV